ncbi:MAG: DUF1501 domain-containing protein [Spirochaetales bacterium]|nr:DUF1501 domain-containing protein [Spirochaetales bacterium]
MFIRKNGQTSRRGFIRQSLTLLGAVYGLPRLLMAANNPSVIRQPTTVRSVIFLNMAGGMSHLETLDPKNHPDVRGPFGSVETKIKGVRLSDRLPRTAREIHRLTMVRSVHSGQGDHSRGQHILHSGHDFQSAFTDLPSLGAVIAFAQNKQKTAFFPDHVTIGGRSGLVGRGGFLGSQFNSFHVSNPDRPLQNIRHPQNLPAERLSRREQMLDLLHSEFSGRVTGTELTAWQEMHTQALAFMNSSELSVFEIEKEKPELAERFGSSATGKSFLLALRLARSGIPFIEVTVGGFDTHQNNTARMEAILKDLDPALAALTAELDASGLFKQTMLVLGSEFGRTPVLSANGDGRDHYPSCWTMLVGGGPFHSGLLYGESDERGQKIVKDPAHLKDMVATIYHAAGVDPEGSLENSMGRPFPLVPEGRILTGLLKG